MCLIRAAFEENNQNGPAPRWTFSLAELLGVDSKGGDVVVDVIFENQAQYHYPTYDFRNWPESLNLNDKTAKDALTVTVTHLITRKPNQFKVPPVTNGDFINRLTRNLLSCSTQIRRDMFGNVLLPSA